MAKNKDRANIPPPSPSSDNATGGEALAERQANDQLPLLEEVQSFLNQRAELLRKVACDRSLPAKR
jgi:hypothetical protein